MDQAVRVAVSTVIFTLRESQADHSVPGLWTPFVRRTREPHLGTWALPGGWLPADEELEDAAARTLAATTGLRPSYMEQLYTFGTVDRSPTDRVISVVYWALVRGAEVEAATPANNVGWFPVSSEATLPALAFDHGDILEYTLNRLRTKVEYSQIAHSFLGETFTLTELRMVHEAVRGHWLDPANFRRSALANGELEDTGKFQEGTPHRPPKLYRYRDR